MKKIILTSAIIFASIATTFAQVTPSATVNLNVKLNAIQSIATSGSNIDLIYDDINDYQVGVSSDQKKHLTVYSTGAFVVKVASSVEQLNGTTGGQTIESSGISVVASGGAATLTPVYKPVNLGTDASELISTSMGGISESFDIVYKAAGNNAYVNKFFKNGTTSDATVYSTVVTYSIEAK